MRYRPLEVAVWNRPEFLRLSDDAKLVFFHLRTSPSTTSFGLFRASIAALIDEISFSQPKPWTPSRYLKAASLLQEAALAYYDESSRLWFIPTGLTAPTSPNALKAWKPLFDELPESKLKDAWLSRLDEIAQGIKDGMRNAIADAFPMASGMASAMGLISISNTVPIEKKRGPGKKGGDNEPVESFLAFVRMTKSEHSALVAKLGEQPAEQYIERLNGYIGQIGEEAAQKKYRSHYYTILNWVKLDEKRTGKAGRSGGLYEGRESRTRAAGDSQQDNKYSGFSGTTV
jgi:hypothetical protein